MAASIPNSPRRDSRSFQKIVDGFLGGEGLPFATVLSAERIERIFRAVQMGQASLPLKRPDPFAFFKEA
jgi:hypothetical protein